jgi:hypothetical protein
MSYAAAKGVPACYTLIRIDFFRAAANQVRKTFASRVAFFRACVRATYSAIGAGLIRFARSIAETLKRLATRRPPSMEARMTVARRMEGREGDALEVLHAEHVALMALLEKLRSGRMRARTASRQLAAVCNGLVRHAQVERELFYPALRGVAGLDDFLDAARVEHQTINELIHELINGKSRDGLRPARIEALAMYVAHHFEEEEARLFPPLRASGIDLAHLGRRIAHRFIELEDAEFAPCHPSNGAMVV